MQPVASISNFASPGFLPLCCVYPIQQLSGVYNNCLVGSSPVVTVGSFYGIRNNINICNQFCPPDILIPVGVSKSLAGNSMKAKLGDSIGTTNGRIFGTLPNTLIL